MERQQSTLAEGSLLSSTTITPVTHPKNTLLSSLHQTFKGSQTFMLQPSLVGHTIKWKQTTEIIKCTHTHTHTCKHTHTHAHTHNHTHTHTHTCTHTHTHTPTHTHKHTNMHRHTHTHTHSQTCTDTHTHTHIHTHTHTHILPASRRCLSSRRP